MRYSLLAAALAVTLHGAVVKPVQAAEITVLSGNGARVAVAELARQFEQTTGHKVTVKFEVNPQMHEGSRGARRAMSRSSTRRCWTR